MGLGAKSGLDQGPQVARVIGCIRDDVADALEPLDQTPRPAGSRPRCPAVGISLTGSPSASTAAWSFVVRPPRERPIP